MAYIFIKKENRKQGCTNIRCGRHLAVIYKQGSEWVYRVGSRTTSDMIPTDQHSIGHAATKKAAIVQAEAAIVGQGPGGVDYMDCAIEYWTEKRYMEAFGDV